MSELSVFYHGGAQAKLVGKLVMFKQKIYFEYDAGFLESGLNLSPFLLPLKSGAQTPQANNPWHGLFGVFNDSLPDGWGLLLMDRHLQSLGVDIGHLSPLDRLAYIGNRGMGALSYKPSKAMGKEGFDIDLSELAASAISIYEGNTKECLAELSQAGGSPGGARPKVLVHTKEERLISGEGKVPDSYTAWIVKFHASDEPSEAGRIEYAYSRMAKAAGIIMPETRLFEDKYGNAWFAIQRFDRVDGKCIHMHTMGGLVDADFRLPSLDYIEVLKVTQALTRHEKDVEQAFAVMVFNVLAKNRDDHSKNFSFLMDEQGVWRLTPAYDLTYSTGVHGEHTTSIAGEGKNPEVSHMLKVGQSVGLKATVMEKVIDNVRESISRWDEWCDMAGIAKAKRELNL
ncbi:MAG: type II toxin-antitoxin system HipA family toxin [Mariprofundaceae bacterium]|nr:type II toxin-antitoxin system HipA family toxin [Mariprofundaceae bacterium]